MRISDWSSDVCSSDLYPLGLPHVLADQQTNGHARNINQLRCVATHKIAAFIEHRVIGRYLLAIARTASAITQHTQRVEQCAFSLQRARKSGVSIKSVSVRVDRGGRRVIKKKQ